MDFPPLGPLRVPPAVPLLAAARWLSAAASHSVGSVSSRLDPDSPPRSTPHPRTGPDAKVLVVPGGPCVTLRSTLRRYLMNAEYRALLIFEACFAPSLLTSPQDFALRQPIVRSLQSLPKLCKPPSLHMRTEHNVVNQVRQPHESDRAAAWVRKGIEPTLTVISHHIAIGRQHIHSRLSQRCPRAAFAPVRY